MSPDINVHKSADGKAISLWVDTGPETDFPKLEAALEADVAVIGGGIAGLTAALLLKRAGVRVAVIEAGRVGTGVTGHTTGKVSSLQRLVYRDLRRGFGEHGARVYGEANEAALEWIASCVQDEPIDCDFRRVSNFTYAESRPGVAQVAEEAQIAQALGLPAGYTDSTPLPFAVEGAVEFGNQAQLHATKYLAGLAQAVAGDGSHVFEQSRVVGIDDGDRCRVTTADGSVTADSAIVATNFPILDRGLFSLRCHLYRSYLIAVELEGEPPEGTFISAEEPLRSIMPHRSGEQNLLLVGGEGHRAIDATDAAERYRRLETWTRQRFPVSSLQYRWSTQDALPLDGVPYVGPMSPRSQNLYVATGFRKWGLTNGTVAAMILSDRVLGRENPWASVFDSNRLKLRAGARRFVTENFRAGVQGLRDRIAARGPALPQLQRGEARVLELGGEKVAVHRNRQGEVRTVSAVCTHLGCDVEWNGTEETWDCPCHGSRFDDRGAVLQGPATEPLPPWSES
jgi:glycine/D-amino acid oxidase-like deaminating enzyme/nitrite reductase/ring-hydroxylating ferredoxin subunit